MKVVINEQTERAVDLDERDIEECEIHTSPVVMLSLDSNRLTSFVFGDRAFPNLVTLSLFGNPIQILDIYRSQVPKLNRLYLRNTKIEFVDLSVIEFVKGKKVEPRSHILGTIGLVEGVFFPKGHPIAEEIIKEIQV